MTAPDRTAADAAVTRGYFPAGRVVELPVADGPYYVRDPVAGTTWRLGPAEFDAARRFGSARSYEMIACELTSRGRRRASPQQLMALEERLLEVGLLVRHRQPGRGARRWPGRLAKPVLRLTWLSIAAFGPGELLDATTRRAPWLASRRAVTASAIPVLAVLVLLGARSTLLIKDVPTALRGWGLLWLWLVCGASAVFHEGGHALACRAYGVAVRSAGIGLRCMTVYAWTEPDPDAWSALPRRAKAATIVAGTYGSLVFAALGGVMWLLPDCPAAGSLGLYAVLAGTVAEVPTLLPFFPGDAYLILTDLLGWQNLRSRSFAGTRALLAGSRPAGRAARLARLGHLGFALATVICHAALAACVCWLVWTSSLASVAG